MSNLEETLRKIAKAGNFGHLTVATNADGMFCAAFRDVLCSGHRIAESKDLVDAIMESLRGSARRKPSKPTPITPDNIDDLVG